MDTVVVFCSVLACFFCSVKADDRLSDFLRLSLMEQQVSVFVKSYYKMGETAKETYSFLKVAFCDEALSYSTASEWYRCLKKCWKIVER